MSFGRCPTRIIGFSTTAADNGCSLGSTEVQRRNFALLLVVLVLLPWKIQAQSFVLLGFLLSLTNSTHVDIHWFWRSKTLLARFDSTISSTADSSKRKSWNRNLLLLLILPLNLLICINLSILIIRLDILDFIVNHVFIVIIRSISALSCISLVIIHIFVFITLLLELFSISIDLIDIIQNLKSIPVATALRRRGGLSSSTVAGRFQILPMKLRIISMIYFLNLLSVFRNLSIWEEPL